MSTLDPKSPPPYELHEFDLSYASYTGYPSYPGDDQYHQNQENNNAQQQETQNRSLGDDLRDDFSRMGCILNSMSVRPFVKQMARSNSYNAGRRQAAFIILAIVLMISFVILPAIALGIGISTLNQCSLYTLVPKWLIVWGFVLLADVFFNFCIFGLFIGDDSGPITSLLKTIQLFIHIFVFAFVTVWVIIGTKWMYKFSQLYNDNTDSSLSCNPTCYQFAYWLLFLIWFTFFFLVCLLLIYFFTKIIFHSLVKRQ